MKDRLAEEINGNVLLRCDRVRCGLKDENHWKLSNHRNVNCWYVFYRATPPVDTFGKGENDAQRVIRRLPR